MVAIIMCTWKRLEKLGQTIQLLSEQTNKDFHFYIWNNNPNITKKIKQHTRHKKWITMKQSPINIGGFGRFRYAQLVSDKHDKVIFIDDDQIFKPNFVESMLNEYEPQTIKSWFSWRFNNDNYWNRTRIKNGSNVDYCGTGGMVLPIEIFKDEALFEDCPEEYRFVEDLWLSFYANHIKGWKLKSTKNVWIKIEVDNKDQFVGLKRKKVQLLKHLVNEKGWKLNHSK